jgi:hypothetical protein
MKKRKYAKKSDLEKHPVYKDVVRIWNESTDTYAHGYLRGMAMVDKHDEVYEELMLLSLIKRTLANETQGL